MGTTFSRSQYVSMILILGSLTALGPFTIDMYLPGFPAIAKDLHTLPSKVSLSLSSYFIGISVGQFLYGPLLDKYGRKPPLLFGLGLYVSASLACVFVTSIEGLIAWRFFQALGSCAANVAAMATVRDIFPVKDNAKVFALLMLVVGASPMVAPTLGGYLTSSLGWQAVFVVLTCMGILNIINVVLWLPDKYVPDRTLSLDPKSIIQNFAAVVKVPQFSTYAMAGAITFSGLFAYISASPNVFMEHFSLDGKVYGWVFAFLSIFFIGSSQINSMLLRWYRSEQIVRTVLCIQVIIASCFLVSSLLGWMNVTTCILFLMGYLSCLGIINPNTAALSLAPFSQKVGSASAVLGASQMTAGAIVSMAISLSPGTSTLPLATALTVTASTGFIILIAGTKISRKGK
ncbi:multidrug effflux MFS transporter [Chitinophaga caeni]|nr:multidrug effflux MFS transporter [Chitinophaga caeni]